jgi:hypothetical protein
MSDDRQIRTFEQAFKNVNISFKDGEAVTACIQVAEEFSITAEKIAADFDLLNSTRCACSCLKCTH